PPESRAAGRRVRGGVRARVGWSSGGSCSACGERVAWRSSGLLGSRWFVGEWVKARSVPEVSKHVTPRLDSGSRVSQITNLTQLSSDGERRPGLAELRCFGRWVWEGETGGVREPYPVSSTSRCSGAVMSPTHDIRLPTARIAAQILPLVF